MSSKKKKKTKKKTYYIDKIKHKAKATNGENIIQCLNNEITHSQWNDKISSPSIVNQICKVAKEHYNYR